MASPAVGPTNTAYAPWPMPPLMSPQTISSTPLLQHTPTQDLRLQLLDAENNADLIKSLYGLLMLLPQSEAFKLLRYRLECIPHFHFNSVMDARNPRTKKGEERPLVAKIPFKELLNHFLQVQAKHREAKRKNLFDMNHHPRM